MKMKKGTNLFLDVETYFVTCPYCGKKLIRLEPHIIGEYNFWCDDCNVDIEIKNKNVNPVEKAYDILVAAKNRNVDLKLVVDDVIGYLGESLE